MPKCSWTRIWPEDETEFVKQLFMFHSSGGIRFYVNEDGTIYRRWEAGESKEWHYLIFN